MGGGGANNYSPLRYSFKIVSQLFRAEDVQRAFARRRQRGHVAFEQSADQCFDFFLRGGHALAGTFLPGQTLCDAGDFVALVDDLVGLVGGQHVFDKCLHVTFFLFIVGGGVDGQVRVVDLFEVVAQSEEILLHRDGQVGLGSGERHRLREQALLRPYRGVLQGVDVHVVKDAFLHVGQVGGHHLTVQFEKEVAASEHEKRDVFGNVELVLFSMRLEFNLLLFLFRVFHLLDVKLFEEVLPVVGGGRLATEITATKLLERGTVLLFRHFVERIVVGICADGGRDNLFVLGTVGDNVGKRVVKVDHRGERHGAEGFLHRGVEEPEEQPLVLQFDLHFGGADVDVDHGGVDFKGDEVGGVRTLRDEVGVRLLNREVEQTVTHVAMVDKHVLLAFPLGVFGLGDETGDAHQFVVELHGEKFVVEVLPENVDDALAHVGSGQQQDELAVIIVLEGEIVVDECDAVKFLFDVCELHLVGLEEVSAGGHVEEEVFDGDGGAVGAGDGRMFLDVGTFDKDEGAHLVGGGLGFELHVRDGRDGGEGLTAEPLGADVEQVVGLAQLRGGVPLEAEARVVKRHAFAVVGHLDERFAGILDDELDLGCAGIHGVFEQLFDHGGGSLHDLSGRYLVRHRIGQQAYDVFHRVKNG